MINAIEKTQTDKWTNTPNGKEKNIMINAIEKKAIAMVNFNGTKIEKASKLTGLSIDHINVLIENIKAKAKAKAKEKEQNLNEKEKALINAYNYKYADHVIDIYENIINTNIDDIDDIQAYVSKSLYNAFALERRKQKTKFEFSLSDNYMDYGNENKALTYEERISKQYINSRLINQHRALVKTVITSLKKPYRKLFTLAYIKGLNTKQISDKTGKSHSNICHSINRLNQALKSMKNEKDLTKHKVLKKRIKAENIDGLFNLSINGMIDNGLASPRYAEKGLAIPIPDTGFNKKGRQNYFRLCAEKGIDYYPLPYSWQRTNKPLNGTNYFDDTEKRKKEKALKELINRKNIQAIDIQNIQLHEIKPDIPMPKEKLMDTTNQKPFVVNQDKKKGLPLGLPLRQIKTEKGLCIIQEKGFIDIEKRQEKGLFVHKQIRFNDNVVMIKGKTEYVKYVENKCFPSIGQQRLDAKRASPLFNRQAILYEQNQQKIDQIFNKKPISKAFTGFADYKGMYPFIESVWALKEFEQIIATGKPIESPCLVKGKKQIRTRKSNWKKGQVKVKASKNLVPQKRLCFAAIAK